MQVMDVYKSMHDQQHVIMVLEDSDEYKSLNEVFNGFNYQIPEKYLDYHVLSLATNQDNPGTILLLIEEY